MGCVWSQDELSTANLRLKELRLIANGGFSEVYLCRDSGGESYAVKRIAITRPEDRSAVLEEIDIHRKLVDCPSAVKLLDLVERDAEYNLIFPFYSNGNLASSLEKRRQSKNYLDEQTVVRYALSLSRAVLCLHNISIAHFDLKTANLLHTAKDDVVLTDFGSARSVPISIDDSKTRIQEVDYFAEHCTMPYRAPELFSCELGREVVAAADIWSLGCCLYAMCYFVSPFDLVHESGGSIPLATQSPQKIPYPADTPFCEELQGVIKSLLQVEPDERPSIMEVIKGLEAIQMNTVIA